MPETKKKSVPQFRGRMFRVEEFSSSELNFMFNDVKEKLNVRPTHMIVNAGLDQTIIHMPEEYNDIEIQVKPYIFTPKVVWIGVWS